MSAPILALMLIVTSFFGVVAASYFKRLDSGIWTEARIPVIAGLVAGVLIRIVPGGAWNHAIAVGVILTAAALYVRLTGRESEPSDGMALGAMTGIAAAVPLVLGGERELIRSSECILAGAVAGFGITFGLTHVRDRLRQAGVDAATAALAIVAAWLPTLLSRLPRITERQIAITAAALAPLLVIATVFRQWPALRAELGHEAALGFIDAADVAPTAHPIRRLGRAGWHDAGAHREFVRLAHRIALRKRQQRHRPDEVARIYQLEVIKLRMQLQEMKRIDAMMRNQPLHEEAI